jgi:hypothetical protein
MRWPDDFCDWLPHACHSAMPSVFRAAKKLPAIIFALLQVKIIVEE